MLVAAKVPTNDVFIASGAPFEFFSPFASSIAPFAVELALGRRIV